MEVTVRKDMAMMNYMDWKVEDNIQKYYKMHLYNHYTVFSLGAYNGQKSVAGGKDSGPWTLISACHALIYMAV